MGERAFEDNEALRSGMFMTLISYQIKSELRHQKGPDENWVYPSHHDIMDEALRRIEFMMNDGDPGVVLMDIENDGGVQA